MLDSVQGYSRYVYSLQERHPQIQQLRLSLYTTGTTDGILKGEIRFLNDIILHVMEIIPLIKQNRIPAPEMSFEHPNLDFLVEEIERELLG